MNDSNTGGISSQNGMYIAIVLSMAFLAIVWMIHFFRICYNARKIQLMYYNKTYHHSNILHGFLYTFAPLVGICSGCSLLIPGAGNFLHIVIGIYEICCIHWFYFLMVCLMGGYKKTVSQCAYGPRRNPRRRPIRILIKTIATQIRRHLKSVVNIFKGKMPKENVNILPNNDVVVEIASNIKPSNPRNEQGIKGSRKVMKTMKKERNKDQSQQKLQTALSRKKMLHASRLSERYKADKANSTPYLYSESSFRAEECTIQTVDSRVRFEAQEGKQLSEDDISIAYTQALVHEDHKDISSRFNSTANLTQLLKLLKELERRNSRRSRRPSVKKKISSTHSKRSIKKHRHKVHGLSKLLHPRRSRDNDKSQNSLHWQANNCASPISNDININILEKKQYPSRANARKIWCVPPLCCCAFNSKSRLFKEKDLQCAYTCLWPYSIAKVVVLICTLITLPEVLPVYQNEDLIKTQFIHIKLAYIRMGLQTLMGFLLALATWGLSVLFFATRPSLRYAKIGTKFGLLKVLIICCNIFEFAKLASETRVLLQILTSLITTLVGTVIFDKKIYPKSIPPKNPPIRNDENLVRHERELPIHGYPLESNMYGDTLPSF